MKVDDRISSLPLELKAEILSRLPVKILVRVKCVSKIWNSEINTQNFLKLYVQCQARNFEFYDDSLSSLILIGKSTFYSYDFEIGKLEKVPHPTPYLGSTVTKTDQPVIYSCNGLLCFQESVRQFSLYNCVTGSYVLLPTLVPTVSVQIEINRYAGFGYDCTSNDYKILALDIINPINDEFETRYEAHLYSLKSNSWKQIKSLPIGDHMIYFKNALHWSTYSDHSEHDHQTMVISAFNLGIEEYYELQLPNKGQFSTTDTNLVALNGCLHIVHFTFWPSSDRNMTIWIMKEYGSMSWTKLVRFTNFENDGWCFCPLPCAYSKSGRQIIVGFQHFQGNTGNILVGDIQTRKIKKVTVFGVPDDYEEEGFIVMPLATTSVDDPLLPISGKRFYTMQKNNFVMVIVFLLVFLFVAILCHGIMLPQCYRLSSFKLGKFLGNLGTHVFLC